MGTPLISSLRSPRCHLLCIFSVPRRRRMLRYLKPTKARFMQQENQLCAVNESAIIGALDNRHSLKVHLRRDHLIRPDFSLRPHQPSVLPEGLTGKMGLYHKIAKCAQMVTTHERLYPDEPPFDAIVKTRPDLLYCKPVDLATELRAQQRVERSRRQPQGSQQQQQQEQEQQQQEQGEEEENRWREQEQQRQERWIVGGNELVMASRGMLENLTALDSPAFCHEALLHTLQHGSAPSGLLFDFDFGLAGGTFRRAKGDRIQSETSCSHRRKPLPPCGTAVYRNMTSLLLQYHDIARMGKEWYDDRAYVSSSSSSSSSSSPQSQQEQQHKVPKPVLECNEEFECHAAGID